MRISDWGADVCSSDLGPMSPAHAVFPPENAASAFMPFGDALYLDCAARTPMLRSVHAAGLAALAANATPWTQSSEAPEAQVEAVRGLAAGLLDGAPAAVPLGPSAALGLAQPGRA